MTLSGVTLGWYERKVRQLVAYVALDDQDSAGAGPLFL